MLKRDDGHVFRMALDFEDESQMKKMSSKRTWNKQVKEDSVTVGLS